MQDPDGARKRILIADDHPLVRTGLSTLLGSEPDLEVCGECGTLPETLRKTKAVRPDLLILDLSFGEGDSLNLIKSLTALNPDVKILVCSMHEESLYAERVIKAGASGYISKAEANTSIVTAARAVLAGEVYLSERVCPGPRGSIGGREPGGNTSIIGSLTDRELEVFGLIGQGRTTSEIAARLNLSVKTIETHRDKIKKKLGLRTAAELTHRAVQWVLLGKLDDRGD